MPKLTSVSAAGIAMLAVGMLACGCAERTPPVEVATPSDDARTLPRPTADDAQRWADTVIPENALGGASWTQREAGVLDPGGEPIIAVTAAEAPAIVTIACVTGSGSQLTYTVTANGETLDSGEATCAAVDENAEAHSIRDVPADATVELSASATGLFVYAVTPDRHPER
ncbi:hypothetical protein C1N74_02020 [Microbacterium sp. SGAir0570]|uniref:hypothetical protein n=1 Tax=Microbacterium sp. SGAir0570 TaxID=2070348 RepID=UPI0010CCDF3E|nr:hypothetical protein [Microbacterium sp. SGAir0570]QCR39321.1 hypothetical protein C1N74_02020 [Microbacterium sp. SGAir0570]